MLGIDGSLRLACCFLFFCELDIFVTHSRKICSTLVCQYFLNQNGNVISIDFKLEHEQNTKPTSLLERKSNLRWLGVSFLQIDAILHDTYERVTEIMR